MIFSDGKPVTSADVVYSFSRILRPGHQVAGGRASGPSSGCGRLRQGPGHASAGIKALSDHRADQADRAGQRVQVRAGHAARLDHRSRVPAQQADRLRHRSCWTTTRPARRSWSTATRSTGTPRPYVDKVVEKLGVDPHVQLLELEKGQIDLMGDPITAADYLQVAKDPSLPARSGPSSRRHVLRHDEHADQAVRQPAGARGGLVRVRPGLPAQARQRSGQGGQRVPAAGHHRLHREKLVHDQDIAKAKQLLAQAGYPNGFSTTMYSWNTQPWTALDAAAPAGPRQDRDQGQGRADPAEHVLQAGRHARQGADDADVLGGRLPRRQ